MKLTYQGEETEAAPSTVAEFLQARGVTITESVVELNGEILTGDDALSTALAENDVVNAFHIVAGG